MPAARPRGEGLQSWSSARGSIYINITILPVVALKFRRQEELLTLVVHDDDEPVFIVRVGPATAHVPTP